MTRCGRFVQAGAVLGAYLTAMCVTGCHAGSASSTSSPASAAQAPGGSPVYLKVDFDTGENSFTPDGTTRSALVSDPAQALSGRSLHARVTTPGDYPRFSTDLQISGGKDLKVAFSVRASGMQYVAVNMFDRRRGDNTTPASPARIFDGEWHPVVLAVEDFHYNADPPDTKIDVETEFGNLLFHGQPNGPAAEVWIDKVVIYRGHDTTPPEPPTDVQAAGLPDGRVELRWREPPDNTFAVTYSIHRRTGSAVWQKIGESLRPNYQDGNAPAGTHAYRITAADYDNNVSAPSPEVTVTTTASPAAGPAPASWVVDRAGYQENVRRIHAKGAGQAAPDVFLFAGDSNTAAMLYTHILGSWLGRGLTVRQGVGAVTTEFGADMINQYLTSTHPEFAVVLYGTNDQGYGRSISESMRHLATIVDACIAAGTIPILTTIPPRGDDKGRQGGQEQFNRALIELGRRKQVPISYAFEEMMRHDLNKMLFDGLHLTPDAGNDAAGRALRRTMDQVYFALRDASASW